MQFDVFNSKLICNMCRFGTLLLSTLRCSINILICMNLTTTPISTKTTTERDDHRMRDSFLNQHCSITHRQVGW